MLIAARDLNPGEAQGRSTFPESPRTFQLAGDGVWLSGDQGLESEQWVAAWEGWPYSESGLASSIDQWVREDVSDLAGQFNLAAYDLRTGELKFLRDLAGSYSLYFAREGNRFAAASRLADLESSLGLQFPLLIDRLRRIQQDYALSPPVSLFKGVELLGADETLSVASDGGHRARKNPYWMSRLRTELQARESKPEDQPARVASALQTSVREATQERRSCFMLSGGLDSNLLLHARARPQDAGRPTTRAVCFAFPGMDCDESPEAVQSARLAGVELDLLDLSGKRFSDYRDEQCRRCDVLPHVSTYFITEAAEFARAAGNDTIISGLGGDEIFAIPRRRAMALHVRGSPWRAAHDVKQVPIVFLRGLVRRVLSGSDASLRQSIEQSNAMFYLAAAQEADRVGVSLRSPLRDASVLVPALAASCKDVLSGRPPRQFQRDLLDYFQPGLSSTVGQRKAIFNEAVQAEPIDCPELGDPYSPTIGAVAPAFLRVKRAEGVEIV